MRKRSKITSASLKEQMIKGIDTKYDTYKKIALDIWNYIEQGILNKEYRTRNDEVNVVGSPNL